MYYWYIKKGGEKGRMEEKNKNICVEENKEDADPCSTDIENMVNIAKYGLPNWINTAIADWNTDFIYIKNYESHIEIGPAQVNMIRGDNND